MFDPYHKWLGIPKDQRPPTLYQLLSISPDERDLEVIEEAAIRQSGHIRAYQVGQHAAECTKLLNELAQAKTILLNPVKRREYDAKLARAKKKPSPDAITAAAPNPELDFSETPSAVRKRPARRVSDEPADDRGLSLPMLVGIGGGAVGVLAIGAVVLVVLLGSGSARDPLAEGKRPDPKPDVKPEIKKNVNPFEIPDPKPIEKKIVPPVNPPIKPPVNPPVIPPVDPGPIVPPKAGGNDAAVTLFKTDGFTASADGWFFLRVAADGKVERVDHKLRQLSVTGLKGSAPFRFSEDGAMILSVENGLNTFFGNFGNKSYAEIRHKLNPVEAAFSRDNALVAISLAGDPAKSPDGKPLTDVRNRPIWNDCQIQVWDTKVPKKLFTCAGIKAPAESVVFADDGSILSLGGDGFYRWDGATGQQLGHVDYHLMPGRISPDGRRIVGTTRDPALASISIDTKKMLAQYPLEQPGSELALSRDGRFAMYSFAGLDGKGETALWDLETGQKLRKSDVPARLVTLSHDGRIAHFQDQEQRVHRWELDADLAKPDPPKKDPNVVVVPIVTKIDLPPLEPGVKGPVTLLRGQPPYQTSLAVSGDGQWMLHSANRFTQLTNLKTGQTHAFTMPTGSRFCVSDDGKMLASASGTRVSYCSFDDSKKFRDVRAANAVRDLAFSRDGSLLALGTNGTGAVAVSYSPRSNVILKPREDCVVEVIDVPSGQSVTCKGHECAVESVVIAEDRTVLSSGRDGLRRWDVRTGKQLGSFEHDMFPSQISADGKIVVGFDVKTLQLTQWDIVNAKVIRRGKAMTQLPTNLLIAVSPEGRYLLFNSRVPAKEMEMGIIDMQTGEQLGDIEGVAQNLAIFADGLAYYTDVRGHQIVRWQFPVK